jgi:drug/metabolite transporter (DMT)-like permease
MIAGSVSLFIVAGVTGEFMGFHPAEVSRASLIGWGYLVTFGALVGFTAYIYLLRETTPAKATTYAYVNPIVAVLLGWWFAGEPITPRTVVAAAIILASVALITLTGTAE